MGKLIYGISHITFIVKDLDKATKFFKEIFEAKEIYSSEDKKFSISKEKFFLINDLWIAVMEGEEMEKSYNHIAFKIDESDYEKYLFLQLEDFVEFKQNYVRKIPLLQLGMMIYCL